MRTPHWLAFNADLAFQNAAYVAFSFLRHLAPFFTPAAPAFFFGHAVYTAAVKTTSWQLSAFVGFVAALGLESAGIMASHTAIKFYSNGEKGKMWTAIVLSGLYLIAGIGSIVLFDGTEWDSKIVGIAMFCISGIVYAVLGLVADSADIEAKRGQATDSESAQKALEAANALALGMRTIEAKEKVAIAKVTTAPPQIAPIAQPKAKSKAEATTICFSCGVDFHTVKGLSGHGPARCAKKQANI